MMRTGASRLYGWDILVRGTLWPGPIIGERMGAVIRATAEAGHEIGLHAWDHHAWQTRIDRMDGQSVHRALDRGYKSLTAVLGHAPVCSAAPAWKCNDGVLLEKSKFPFLFNSDCRGREIFLPLVQGRPLPSPQIPTTLPTYDEVIGLRGITRRNYNDHLLGLLDPAGLNVLTIHAEVEGMACLDLFGEFLERARTSGAALVPLGALLPSDIQPRPWPMVRQEIPGRQGWLAFQGEGHA
jgi:undecaprenyl phosphate-alpha-L-ara4FN deformylase